MIRSPGLSHVLSRLNPTHALRQPRSFSTSTLAVTCLSVSAVLCLSRLSLSRVRSSLPCTADPPSPLSAQQMPSWTFAASVFSMYVYESLVANDTMERVPTVTQLFQTVTSCFPRREHGGLYNAKWVTRHPRRIFCLFFFPNSKWNSICSSNTWQWRHLGEVCM